MRSNVVTQNPTYLRERLSRLGQFSTTARLSAVAIAISACAVLRLGAQNVTPLPVYEPFPTSYAEGENLGATGSSSNVWSTGNSASSSSSRIRSGAAMSYPGLAATNDITRGIIDGSGTGKNRGLIFSPVVSSGTVYASFLFNWTNVTSANRLFAALSDTTGTGPNIRAGVYINSSGQLLLGKNRGVGDTTLPTGSGTFQLTSNQTYLVVLRYQFNGGTADDQFALWINPTPLGDNASVPPPTITTTNGTDAPSLQSFYYMRASSGLNAFVGFWMDEVRVGTSWSDVVPATPAPGNIYSVTGGGAQCAGGSFPVGVSGSEVGVDYQLYTDGIFTGEIVPGTGQAISFGPQTVSGIYTVLASNTVSGNVGWMKTNATVTIIANPEIATQPNPTTAASGSLAAISVVATGDNLAYHWRRDGTNLVDGGNITGATTPNLIINPATAADAATAGNGYDVVITNSCGLVTATSSRVSLTVGSPANLVWQGDGNNFWDVGVSSDWVNSSTALNSAFNFGDKVTFDDTAFYFSVILSSPFLSPSSITIDSSLPLESGGYTFTGGGSIVGPGSLVKAGAGGIAINTFNSFTGGTTISNGTVLILNSSALGTGPVTLAGGTLSAPNVQGFNIINPINVVADSSISVSNTSTSALVITNTLSGTSGTLTFYNNTTGRGPTVQLTYPGFTFNRNIDLNLGTGTNLVLQVQNTSGEQVFNGVISGGGQLRRLNNGGRTILNGNNTYSGGTFVAGGTLWVNGQIGTGSDFVDVQSGTLGGTGTITSEVTISGGTLAPGTTNIGTLTINGNLTITSNLLFKVNKSVSPSNDLAVISGSLVKDGVGILTVSNLGPALAVGDKFKLFNKAVTGGNLLTVTGGGTGVTWNNNLAVDGTISVATAAPSQPPLITSVNLSGNNIVISGTNGSAGSSFYVLASTNLTLPRSQWTPVATNTFGAGGSLNASIPLSTSAAPARFYLIRVP